MATLDNFKTGIFRWFDSVTGNVPVKWANTQEQMELPYGVIQIIASRDLANADIMPTDEDGTSLDLEWHRIMTVSCNLYGNDSMDLMHKVQASLNNPIILNELEVFGLAYVNNSNIQDLTFFQSTDYIERVQMDVMFSYTYKITTPVDIIESVDIGGIINSADIEGTLDDVILDIEVDVN